MAQIIRLGTSDRWADVVVYEKVARWVEVANDQSQNIAGQAQQIFQQIEETLQQLGSHRNDLLQVTIYLASLTDVPQFNAAWDQWVPRGHAPVRACIQAGLQGNCLIEMIVVAAVSGDGK